jgi:hypothetical protein
MAVVVATNLWVLVDLLFAGSLIFSVSAAMIVTMCLNGGAHILLRRLVGAGGLNGTPTNSLLDISGSGRLCHRWKISSDKI